MMTRKSGKTMTFTLSLDAIINSLPVFTTEELLTLYAFTNYELRNRDDLAEKNDKLDS